MPDADIYSLLMAQDEPTAQEKAAALAAALRGQRMQGNLGMLTGDKVLAPYGQAQLQQAQQQEGLLAGAATHRAGNLLQQLLKGAEAKRAAENRLLDQTRADAKELRGYTEAEKRARIMAGLQQDRADRAAAKPTKIPSSEVSNLSQADSAIETIDKLSTEWDDKASATGSSVKGLIPGTDANLYQTSADAAAQLVGGYLEGGKLGEADLPRYKAMVPQRTDSEAKKAYKVEILKDLISKKRASQLKGFGEAGYDTSGFTETPRGPTGSFNLDSPAPAPAAWTPEKQKRLEELRAKQAAGALK